jgi:hypothetical protein
MLGLQGGRWERGRVEARPPRTVARDFGLEWCSAELCTIEEVQLQR